MDLWLWIVEWRNKGLEINKFVFYASSYVTVEAAIK